MKDSFFNSHKKMIIIGGAVLFVLLFIFFVIFFILPSFGGNAYGDRLDDIKSHKISSSLVGEIKEEMKKSDGVKDVLYNNEGRILNFIVYFDDNYNVDSAKTSANKIIEKIGEKNLKYYDIQIYLEAKGNDFPMIGYHSKGSDGIKWSRVGDGNES